MVTSGDCGALMRQRVILAWPEKVAVQLHWKSGKTSWTPFRGGAESALRRFGVRHGITINRSQVNSKNQYRKHLIWFRGLKPYFFRAPHRTRREGGEDLCALGNWGPGLPGAYSRNRTHRIPARIRPNSLQIAQ